MTIINAVDSLPTQSDPETTLLYQVKVAGLPVPETQYRFCKRRWKYDLAWPDHNLLVDVQGGTFSGGAHVRGAGYLNDVRKMAEAVLLGWRVLWVTSGQVKSGEALGLVERALKVGDSLGLPEKA